MKRSKLFPAVALAALIVPALPAQTGAWTDGEILVRSTVLPSGQRAIYRVVPETGASAVLTTVQNWGGFSGSTLFDSWRGGVLTNASLPPDNAFLHRLWLVSQDGSAAAMPGFTGDLKALASAGDGRVFFIRYTGSTQGPTTIEYFDAQDVIHTLKQADGVTPFGADVEHLLYDAPTNALIGSSSKQWAATNCSATGNSLYRIPLSADGLRVEGAMTCTSVPTSLVFGDLMGLDHLPNGNVLVTSATAFPGAPCNMLTLDPSTLALGAWASPDWDDVNGGLWSARLGQAVIHANTGGVWWEPAGLRRFSAGSTGFGTHIPAAMPDAGGGFSPIENVAEVDLNGPSCDGFQIPYGMGLAGKGAFVPLLGVIGCPDIGQLFTLSINSVVGGASGVLFVGLAPASTPLKGGTFLVGSVAVQVTVAVGGAPGSAGAGSLALPAMLADPILAGIDIYMQAGFADAAAIKGVSLSNGLRVQGN